MRALPEKPWFAAAAAALLIAGLLLVSSFIRSADVIALHQHFTATSSSLPAHDLLTDAILHYATSRNVPQQSRPEIQITLDVLRRRSPCRFLVFGLGLDSPMWAAFNAGGTTVFLEESPEWIAKVLKDAPRLTAHHVPYRTRLDEADSLMRDYKSVPECVPPLAHVSGNERCKLALAELPGEVLEREWDLIMIDAPRGYFAAAPGRMAAVWTAAVMARMRRGVGDTDVFIHDVDRKVEKSFALEFLCEKYRVGGTGRLWHFQIPPSNDTSGTFC